MDPSLEWKVYAVCQIFFATISLASSSTSALMIAKSVEKSGKRTICSSPYHRIIFGISVSDIMTSLAMITGPFAPPSDLILAYWAVGNQTSCQVNGFFLNFGAGCVPLYTCLFCYYCFCKICKNMSDDAFAYKIEWKLHVVVLTYSIAISIMSLLTNAVNPSMIGGICTYSAIPTGCRESDFPGECDQKVLMYSNIFLLLWMFGITLSCLIGIVFSMFMIYWHVVVTRDRVFQGAAATRFGRPHTIGRISSAAAKTGYLDAHIRNAEDLSLESDDDESDPATTPVNINSPQDEATRQVKACKREIMIQGCLFILAFCVTYAPPWAAFITSIFGHTGVSTLLLICLGVFFPLGGFFNILVFFRPKVLKLRKLNSQYSWFRAFFLVMMAGGNLPTPGMESQTDDVTPKNQSRSKRTNHELEKGENCIDDVSFSKEIAMNHLSSGFTSSGGRFALSGFNLPSVSKSESDANDNVSKSCEVSTGSSGISGDKECAGSENIYEQKLRSRKHYSGTMPKSRSPLRASSLSLNGDDDSSSSGVSLLDPALFLLIDTISEGDEDNQCDADKSSVRNPT